MDQKHQDRREKGGVPHEAIQLSRVISEKLQIKVTFPDGEYVIDHLRWHTHDALGMKSGKVINKLVIKYWETVEE